MISQQNSYKELFNLFILVLSVFNSLFVPLELSFEEIPLFNSLYFVIIDNLIDVLFLIDMGLMFMTSYRDKFGKEIFGFKLIALNYVRSARFYTDFFSLLGTSIVTNWAPNFKIFKVIKIVRILRVKQFISRLNISIEVKIILQLLNITFYMFIYLHVQACLWYAVSKTSVGAVDEYGRSEMWMTQTDLLN